MPAAMSPEEAAAAPALSIAPTALPNPVINNDGIKAMAARFNQEMKPIREAAKDAGKAAPDPSKMAPAPTAPPAKDATPAKAEPPPQQPNPQQLEGSMSNPRRADFRALEQARDDFKRQAEEAKAAAKAAAEEAKAHREALENIKKGLPADPAEVQKALTEREQLAKEREELLGLVETANLERSPRFQNWWTTETEQHLKTAERYVSADKRADLRRLLMEPPSTERDAKLDEIVEALPNTSKRLVYSAAEQLETVKLKREEALTQGSVRWKELQAHEKAEAAKATAATKAYQERLAATALARARNLEAFQRKDGDEAHNAEVAQREALVQAMVHGQLDEETAVAVPGAAIQYLYYRDNVVPNLQRTITEQAELIKKLQSAGPSVSDGRATPASTGKTPDEGKGSDFASRVKELMRK